MLRVCLRRSNVIRRIKRIEKRNYVPPKLLLNEEVEQKIGLVGFCVDGNSVIKGASKAPPLVRKALWAHTNSLYTETGLNLGHQNYPIFLNMGDIEEIPQPEARFRIINSAVTSILNGKRVPLAIGGDQSITYPIIHGIRSHLNKNEVPIHVLHFDSSPDLHRNIGNNKYSNVSSFARIMEDDLVTSLVQIGTRVKSKELEDQINKYNVKSIDMKFYNHFDTLEKLRNNHYFPRSEPVYITLDISVLDPAYAPGVSRPIPGGLSTRQLLDIIHSINNPIIAADIVEFNPLMDVNSLTANVVAKLLKEICGMIILTNSQSEKKNNL
eukprot:TRINITY_DN5938_c0_g1_i1.p1 TRINITY_DN5938_c0_g1~~TRINITY_DN5938_c0_g1_i1.p1  ORF type:complete len:325 (-),score=32.46 TRINITY_DN5938_c0_g1_i1:34-1008(-)